LDNVVQKFTVAGEKNRRFSDHIFAKFRVVHEA